MTTLTIELPDNLAQEAQAAGLWTSDNIKKLLEDAMRRRAGEALIRAANNAAQGGGTEPSMDELVEDIKTVRAIRKAAKRSQ